LSALEAMAAGKPLVASAIAPIEENAPSGTAVLVPPDDHQAFAEAIIGLLRDPARRRAMGERARLHADRNCRWERMAALTLEAYEQFSAVLASSRKDGRLPSSPAEVTDASGGAT
jgi:glycosyltransferase involved in cell wall biosynthesis